MREGVIKFECVHERGALPEVDLASLITARQELFVRKLMGRDRSRYDGVSYGNISIRSHGGFVISGTQTSGLAEVSVDDFALVRDWDVPSNRLESVGSVRPSSESMTHAMIYESAPEAGAVLHVHSPQIWHRWQSLALATTGEEVEYGTPDMARAVRELVVSSSSRTFAMLGHEDGVVVWDESVEVALERLIDLHDRALSDA